MRWLQHCTRRHGQSLRTGTGHSDLFGRRPRAEPDVLLRAGSQGAEGRVYPYPLYDTLTNIKSNKIYRIVYLENEYVRIGILPEIGGRLFEAVDKSNGYDFIYRQHVIKPALIGLIGAWISGGIEWNIPHHHRATTFLPVQYRVEPNADGSKTVWVGELEVRHRMRWAVGYTLRPGKSYLECSGPHRQPHARRQHDALLRQRGGACEQQLPGHLSAGHAATSPTTASASSPPGPLRPRVTAAPISRAAWT